jgi:hypothetical protein
MQKIFAFLFIVLSPFTLVLNAQVKTDTSKIPNYRILFIPFEPNMFMSEIGKAVNASTKMSYKDITESFRENLDAALRNAFKVHNTSVSLLLNKKKPDTTLRYIYNSIGYKFDLIPGKDSGETHEEFDPKAQQTHFIHNGQLDVPIDYSTRFMNVNVVNPHLLSSLNKKYGATIFIFVNELDIRNVANTPGEDLTASNFRRQVTVQYSILNMHNQYITDGILTAYFPANVNNPPVIGEKYFSIIGNEMLESFNEAILKRKEGEKKSK